MEEKPRAQRRWFHFSLRTMLVLVTVVCVYLGWAMNWKRQRQEFLDTNEAVYALTIPDPFTGPPFGEMPAPIWIRILGAQGYAAVYLDSREKNEQQFSEVQWLFPESDIYARWKVGEELWFPPATEATDQTAL